MVDPAFDLTPRSTLARLVAGDLDPAALPESQWAQVVPLAVGQGLGPMLLWAMRGRVPISDDEPPWQALVNAARQATVHYALLEHTRWLVSDGLAQAGIPAIWLKGIALAHAVYPEPYLRPMLDLDVLVPYEQREPARQVLEKLGFHLPKIDYLSIIGAPEIVLHHDHLLGGPGERLCLELHFRLLGLEGHRLLPQEGMAWFWGQTQALGPPESGFTILKPEAHLLYLCAHALLQHSEAKLNLLRLLDLHLLIRASQMDWPLIVERARRLGWTYAVGRMLELLVENFATPVVVLSQLKERTPDDVRYAAAAERRGQAARWEEWKVLFRRTSPARRPRMVWTTLFPPSSYLRDVYTVQPTQSVVPYYFYRWWDAGREVSRALRHQWARHHQKGKQNAADESSLLPS